MKVWLSADGVDAEISDKDQRYNPDVLEDWCRRVVAMVKEQRCVSVVLGEDADDTTAGE